jgi:hypothetical protein
VAFCVSAASIAIQYRANHGLVAFWNDKKWDVIARSEVTGDLKTQKQDLGQVRVKDAYSASPRNVMAFSECYFLRDLVVDEDNASCEKLFGAHNSTILPGDDCLQKLVRRRKRGSKLRGALVATTGFSYRSAAKIGERQHDDVKATLKSPGKCRQP